VTDAGYGKIDYLKNTWDDLRIVPGAFSFAGAADPSLSAWQPTGAGTSFLVYEFASADVGYFTVQMPHKYLQGSDLKPHVHWTPRGFGAAENGNTVFWELDYTIANVNGTFGAAANVQMHDTCSGTNEKHEITTSGTITGTGLTVSHMIVGRITRAAGDTWNSGVPNQQPVLLEIDFHYQLDTTGSDNETSKTNKNS